MNFPSDSFECLPTALVFELLLDHVGFSLATRAVIRSARASFTFLVLFATLFILLLVFFLFFFARFALFHLNEVRGGFSTNRHHGCIVWLEQSTRIILAKLIIASSLLRGLLGFFLLTLADFLLLFAKLGLSPLPLFLLARLRFFLFFLLARPRFFLFLFTRLALLGLLGSLLALSLGFALGSFRLVLLLVLPLGLFLLLSFLLLKRLLLILLSLLVHGCLLGVGHLGHDRLLLLLGATLGGQSGLGLVVAVLGVGGELLLV